MSFLTKPTVVKGQPATFTLVKSQLASVTKVASDSFFADITNWKRVTITFKNLQGQEEVLLFNAALPSPVAIFSVTARARSNYQITKIIIRDLDDGTFMVKRSDLSAELLTQLDVSLQTPEPT